MVSAGKYRCDVWVADKVALAEEPAPASAAAEENGEASLQERAERRGSPKDEFLAGEYEAAVRAALTAAAGKGAQEGVGVVAEHLTEICQPDEVYRIAGLKSRHGLPQYLKKAPENKLAQIAVIAMAGDCASGQIEDYARALGVNTRAIEKAVQKTGDVACLSTAPAPAASGRRTSKRSTRRSEAPLHSFAGAEQQWAKARRPD
jgi:hypothetical protein